MPQKRPWQLASERVWHKAGRDPTDEAPDAIRREAVVDLSRGEVQQCRPIPVIPSKELVASLAAQNHLHVPLRELRYKVKRYARRGTERLVLVPDQVWERRREIRRFDENLVV